MMELGLALILIGGAVVAIIGVCAFIREIVANFMNGDWDISVMTICLILVVTGAVLYAIGGYAG